MCGGGSGDAAKQAEQERIARERQRRQRIEQGMASIDSTLDPFNDDFFAEREQAYISNATPRLDDDIDRAKRDLIFALSRGGL